MTRVEQVVTDRTNTNVLDFPGLPFWRGVLARPGLTDVLPFRLVWDQHGFCRQAASADVTERVVSEYGSGEYVHITPPPGSASEWADRFGLLQADFVEKNARKGGQILEIGAGTLFLARRLTPRLAAERYVVADPAVTSGEGIAEVVSSYFPADSLQGRKFRTILAFNSLEHCEDPVAFLSAIGRHLEVGGRGIICAPDVANQFAIHDLNALVHEHISYFTPETFDCLARQCGLRVVSATSDEDTLWAVVEAAEPDPGSVARLPWLFASAKAAMLANLTKKAGMVAEHARRGAVAFHGATPGLNNFLHLAGMTGRSDIALFDGDAQKAGRYLPACASPILHTEDPRYATAPVIFVSAMTFFEPIRRFSTARRGAGATLIPLFE